MPKNIKRFKSSTQRKVAIGFKPMATFFATNLFIENRNVQQTKPVFVRAGLGLIFVIIG